jgi:signal transduction histidine kinase
MKPLRLLLVRPSPVVRAAVRAAAAKAFPDAEITEIGRWEEAPPDGWPRRAQLLVLAEPDAAAATAATQAVDAGGLPRWAVVCLGGEGGNAAEAVPREEWQPALVARVFRAALLQHELLRDNLRLQGDLKTVARRIRHDLGSPIGCIGTSAHVVKVSLPPVVRESVAAMVQNIEESSGEISQILDRVSFLLRASAEPVPSVRVDMGGVVAGVLRELAAHLKNTGAEVARPEAWPEVSGVPPWLHVIWWNLLHNASVHGGPAARIQLTWEEVEDGYRFTVGSGGPPLDPVVRAHLFPPFDQLHLRPSPGLGLTIVHRLVALQGGHCGYERRPDGSSAFCFTLPR